MKLNVDSEVFPYARFTATTVSARDVKTHPCCTARLLVPSMLPMIIYALVKRPKATLFGVALALLAVLGLRHLRRVYPYEWASIAVANQSGESILRSLETALRSVGDDQGFPRGGRVDLASFIQSNGRRIDVTVIEGEFFDQVIEPRDAWHALGSHLMIVSSVDENRSAYGPLSGPIANGCSVASAAVPLQLGQATIVPCTGSYHDGGHFDWVGTVSPVIWNSETGGKQPCWDSYGIADLTTGYQACVANAVSDSLRELFVEIRRNTERHIDGIVTPSVGTGYGQLSKAAFYQTLLDNILIEELKKDYDLPARIYLQVRRDETPNRWPETRIAIANSLAKAVSLWSYDSEHKPGDSEWLSLTGVAMGSSILLLLLGFGIRLRPLTTNVEVIWDSPSIFLVIAYLSCALGLVSFFKALAGLLPSGLNPYFQVGAGLLTALACVPLVNANSKISDTGKTRLGD